MATGYESVSTQRVYYLFIRTPHCFYVLLNRFKSLVLKRPVPLCFLSHGYSCPVLSLKSFVLEEHEIELKKKRKENERELKRKEMTRRE